MLYFEQYNVCFNFKTKLKNILEKLVQVWYKLAYIRSLEIAEMKEKDMPMV